MPGHKGKIPDSCGEITEVYGADVLSDPHGIIAESERNAASLFGSARTVYSTEGCSLSIRMMICLTSVYAKITGKDPVVYAARNAHKSFVNALSLTGLDVKWVVGDRSDVISGAITPEILESVLRSSGDKPVAVYITTPDYLGNMLDVAGIKKTCKKYGALLLVDNAHGAYLNFLDKNEHPMFLGADMCCDSAHKTLPCLTGGAYLHINNAVNEVIGGYIPLAADRFSSTSPSWLILASLDRLNRYLSDGYREKLNEYISFIDLLRGFLKEKGFYIVGDEKLKLTIKPKSYGYTGVELGEILRKSLIEPEFTDKDNVVMMFTPENGFIATEKVKKALSSIKPRSSIDEAPPRFYLPSRAMSIQNAVNSLSEEICVNDAIGRVFAFSALSCPPAVPIAVAGEIIDENVLRLFTYYDIKTCRVVK